MVIGLPVVFDMISHPFGINLAMNSKALHHCICAHFLSKFLDYLDTFFIVIEKADKRLSVLHVYHHWSISMVWGYLIDTGFANGTVCYGAWINAVIHTIMYAYYGFSAAQYPSGKKIFDTRPVRVWVTRCQLVQFVTCLVHAIMALQLEKNVPAGLCYLQFGYHCTMIALFGQFYMSSYGGKKSKDKESKKSQ